MPDLDLISKRLEELQSLSDKQAIFLDDLRAEFRPDLQQFITGETLTLHQGKVVIGRPLFRQWLQKLRTRGFDYEIAFR